MTSELKSAASRANGAKSQGPKSPEMRDKSSRNSVKHGFTSKKTVVLAVEDPDQFQEMLAYYAKTYQPGSPVEEDLITEMVAARWRMRRLRMIETALMDSELERGHPENGFNSSTERGFNSSTERGFNSSTERGFNSSTERSFNSSADLPVPQDPGYKIAFAFRSLVSESRAISLASRYESRLHRIHEGCHRTFRELQKIRIRQTAEPAAPAPIQPEAPPPAPTASPEPPVKNDETNLSTSSSGVPNIHERALNSSTKGLSIAAHRGSHRIDNVVSTITRINRFRNLRSAQDGMK